MQSRSVIAFVLAIACPAAARAENTIAFGGMAGGNEHLLITAVTIDTSIGFAPGWAVHGELATGSGDKLMILGGSTVTSSFSQARAGVEYAGRVRRGWGLVGVDAGRQWASWSGISYGLFGDSTMESTRRVTNILVPRAAVEVGNENLRLRAGIEAAFDTAGWNGGDVSLAMACHW